MSRSLEPELPDTIYQNTSDNLADAGMHVLHGSEGHGV